MMNNSETEDPPIGAVATPNGPRVESQDAPRYSRITAEELIRMMNRAQRRAAIAKQKRLEKKKRR